MPASCTFLNTRFAEYCLLTVAVASEVLVAVHCWVAGRLLVLLLCVSFLACSNLLLGSNIQVVFSGVQWLSMA